MKKLTARQQEVLNEMLKPDVKAFHMPYMGRFNPRAYWYLSTSHEKVTSQVEALIKLGLVKISKFNWRGHEAEAVRSHVGL